MITLEPTADGSNTLYVPELNEHYHSVKGALTESAHIFIQMGLNHAQAINPRVLEIGFGTGLNAFLTLLEAERSQRAIHFTSIERFPLPEEIVRELAYPETIAPEECEKFYALHTASWNQEVKISRFFVKFGGTSSIVNKESWLSVVCFLPYCTSAFLPL